MLSNKSHKVLLSLSLSVLAMQVCADQAAVPAGDPANGAEQAVAEGHDWTWFGMGFESRQDQFRRDMDAALPGASSSGSGTASSGGNGQGGGK